MQCVSKEVFIPFTDGRPVFPGFVSYAHPTDPIIIHRSGWVDASDTYDDFADRISTDNGKSWSEPVLMLKSRQVPQGRTRYAENAAFLDPDTAQFHTFTSFTLYPKDDLDVHATWRIEHNSYCPKTAQWQPQGPLELGTKRSVGISFCLPIKTSRGKIIVPAYTSLLDDQGQHIHYGDCWSPLDQPVTIVGSYDSQAQLQWRLGTPVAVDPEKVSRGISENTIAELQDGRLVMIGRGDNSMYPDRPGYKWVCFSDDDGLTWSQPEPLGCTEGDPIESGSNGALLFRSQKTQKLYLIANLCVHGKRPCGNWPRTPITIAEIAEDPVAIKRETVTVIDQQQPGEPDVVQMSNFRFYQERPTGDIILFLARFSERDAEDWKQADYYRYRVVID